MNRFEKHKVLTYTVFLILLTLATLVVAEMLLSRTLGLGNPVIYESYPLYGYRPRPNREYQRFFGARISFNNLALRAERGWDVIRAKGYRHIIFISTRRKQVVDGAARDSLVGASLVRHGVGASYLLDTLRGSGQDLAVLEGYFGDDIHLTREGHKKWAEMIVAVLRPVMEKVKSR